MVKSKKRRGRPKGSRNKYKGKVVGGVFDPLWGKDFKVGSTLRVRLPKDYVVTNNPSMAEPSEPPSYLSRLEAATVKYEQAINEAITALKGN